MPQSLSIPSIDQDQVASIRTEIVPTGGIVVIGFSSGCDTSGTWVLTRAASDGSPPTVLRSGPPIEMYVDPGDGLQSYLDPTLSYTYTLQTPTQTVASDPVSPTCGIVVQPDTLTLILLRAFQAAFAGLALPPGFGTPNVRHAMPIQGRPQLPLISFALEAMNDTQVPLGQNSGLNGDGITEPVYEIVSRRYRVTAMALTVDEREYYRDAIIGIFKTYLGPLLASLGQNVTHAFHAANSQVTSADQAPGFYFTDISLQFSGTYYVSVVRTGAGVFQAINPLDP